jgi:hypothetical protein
MKVGQFLLVLLILASISLAIAGVLLFFTGQEDYKCYLDDVPLIEKPEEHYKDLPTGKEKAYKINLVVAKKKFVELKDKGVSEEYACIMAKMFSGIQSKEDISRFNELKGGLEVRKNRFNTTSFYKQE